MKGETWGQISSWLMLATSPLLPHAAAKYHSRRLMPFGYAGGNPGNSEIIIILIHPAAISLYCILR
jgi:hypothetical protein